MTIRERPNFSSKVKVDTARVRKLKLILSSFTLVFKMTEVLKKDSNFGHLSGEESDKISYGSDQVKAEEQIEPLQVNGHTQKGDMTQECAEQKDAEIISDVQMNADIKENNVHIQSRPTVNVQDSTKQTDEFTEGTVEEKADEKFIDILGNGLLTKKVLVEGKGRESRPDRGDIVTLDIEGHLSDGTAVDKYNSFSFPLGEGDVVQALDLGVSLMEIGETCELFAASKFAYGERGREPDIPPNSDITYTLELLKYEKKPELDKISQEVKHEMGDKKRERGNFLFSRQDFTGAINSYTQAIKILDYPSATPNETSINQQELLDCKLKCCNNLAACQLKVGAYEAAIRSTEIVLLSQPNNVKALFRIGKAYSAKGNTNEGIRYFKKALQLEPESKIIHQELSKLSKKLKSETESEKEMYRRMLGTKNTKNESKRSGSSWIKWTLIAGGLAVAGLSIAIATLRGNH